MPQYEVDGRDAAPDDARALCRWLTEHGAGADFDVVAEGETAADPIAAGVQVTPWADAGCTWWLETRWEMPHHTPERMNEIRERLAAGPPAVTAPATGSAESEG